MSFHVGQKVCCVDDKPRAPWPICRLRRGKVYTVTRVISHWESIEVAEAEACGASGFWNDRFRPIVSRKTDISALTALLVPGSKIRETA